MNFGWYGEIYPGFGGRRSRGGWEPGEVNFGGMRSMGPTLGSRSLFEMNEMPWRRAAGTALSRGLPVEFEYPLVAVGRPR